MTQCTFDCSFIVLSHFSNVNSPWIKGNRKPVSEYPNTLFPYLWENQLSKKHLL